MPRKKAQMRSYNELQWKRRIEIYERRARGEARKDGRATTKGEYPTIIKGFEKKKKKKKKTWIKERLKYDFQGIKGAAQRLLDFLK